MGVPAFFRWLSRKYGSIIVDAVEEKNRDVDGVKVPVDTTQPNPNFQEFDNLYLDMNGIIHPCTHPEDRPAPKTEEDMFILIFEYIDRLFSIVRPRRVLYMAIDGVAPRAKMNQQRSRRFRAAKETIEKQEQILSVRRKLESEGVPLPPPKKEEEHFDSNCITPGTPFMDRLAMALRYYVHKKISTDPAWQSIQIILSDANAPGEGEHKIMNFIRRQRASPSHDPNTVHCLCGADADLIMLGLATHEANFNILREEFVPNQPKACELCGQYGHELDSCQGLARDEAGPDQVDPLKKEKNFIFIRLPVLREYLALELAMPNLPFPYDFERAIDDWVLMCFFVGNDFLPHLPSLEIRENAIDRLIKLYKDVVYQTQGWLTKSGDVYLDRVQTILVELGKAEDEIFRQRQIREVRYRQNKNNRRQRNAGEGFFYPNSSHIAPLNSVSAPRPYAMHNNYGPTTHSSNRFSSLSASQQPTVDTAASGEVRKDDGQSLEKSRIVTVLPKGGPAFVPENASLIAPLSSAPEYMSGAETRRRAAEDRLETQRCAEASERLKAILLPAGVKRPASSSSVPIQGEPSAKSFKDGLGSKGGTKNEDNKVTGGQEEDDEPHDEIRLWEEGWKERYYQAKFGVSESDVEFRRKVAWCYAEGLCWVLKYYYQGCASWNWYFPYHYAPFASDFDTVAQFEPDFSMPTKPFKPLEQLMGVFPAASKAHIPEGWRSLMTDENSPIYDFYPTDFEIDLNGKKFAWQGVALLPFVDEKRLLNALKDVYSTLSDAEIHRNCTDFDRLFVSRQHPAYDLLVEVYQTGKTANFEVNRDENNDVVPDWVYLNKELSNGMVGEVAWDKDAVEVGECYPSLFRNSLEWNDIQPNSCIMVLYRDPQFAEGYVFESNRLAGVNDIENVLKPNTWNDRRDGQFRPQIGFTRNIPHANLSSVGHRLLNHTIAHQNGQQMPSSQSWRPNPNNNGNYRHHVAPGRQHFNLNESRHHHSYHHQSNPYHDQSHPHQQQSFSRFPPRQNQHYQPYPIVQPQPQHFDNRPNHFNRNNNPGDYSNRQQHSNNRPFPNHNKNYRHYSGHNRSNS